MRSEEVEGRADAVLATPVNRRSWALSHVFFAAMGPTIALSALGLTMGLAYGLGAGDIGSQLPRLLARALVTLPAVWVLVGIAVALYGVLPRFAAGVSWALLGLFLALELGWELQRLSQSIFDISPFAHVHWAGLADQAPHSERRELTEHSVQLAIVNLQLEPVAFHLHVVHAR
jgi:ABC-2 type transport system permease protein